MTRVSKRGGINQAHIKPRFGDSYTERLYHDVRHALPKATHETRKEWVDKKIVCKRCGFQSQHHIDENGHCENLTQCFWRILHWDAGLSSMPKVIYLSEEEIQKCLDFIQEIGEI